VHKLPQGRHHRALRTGTRWLDLLDQITAHLKASTRLVWEAAGLVAALATLVVALGHLVGA
jgi:hypothetical protein